MTMDETNIADLTDEQITGADTAQLRTWVTTAADSDNMIYSGDLRAVIFQVEIGNEVIKTGGVLTAIDRLITLLLTAYRDRDAQINKRYADTTEITVWATDESLRGTLRRCRNRLAGFRENAEKESGA